MQTFSSAKRTCSASASTDECTATDLMPSSRQARITRSAISPRFAIRTFLYMGTLRGFPNPPVLAPRGEAALSSGLLHAARRGGFPNPPVPASRGEAALRSGLLHAARRGGVPNPPVLASRGEAALRSGLLHALGEANQLLAVLDVLAVLDEELGHLAVGLGLDLVHELHGLDDAN